MYAHITFATSVENSIHEPRKGITRALYRSVPLGWTDWEKKTPGLRCSWLTMTRSAPLTTNVPFSVMTGRLPR